MLRGLAILHGHDLHADDGGEHAEAGSETVDTHQHPPTAVGPDERSALARACWHESLDRHAANNVVRNRGERCARAPDEKGWCGCNGLDAFRALGRGVFEC